MVAFDSFSFVINTRKGRGWLQVIMAGSGRRPSKAMLGGVVSSALEVFDGLRKRPCLLGTAIAGANWCCRLAYDSLEFLGGRGGSIGKKLKPTS